MTNRPNRLGNEKSPYLLQHQNNPVHWYAWDEEAFAAAKREEKPIFLSIGYSTCHWCHVMAHQSFENQEVADYLNEHFISIKLDREERPDVDEIYMSAVHAMGQRGGWPLSMFLTPELKPFFGGTYWPKDNFLYILQQLTQLWEGDREKALRSSESLIEHLREQKAAGLEATALNREIFEKFLVQSEINYDHLWGGFGSAPKFPHTMQLSMLLRLYRRSGEEKTLQMVIQTLDKMARGGLYDHLGGGFARYSVDEKWMIPHFEKMLYDNALLAVIYLEAFQITGIEMFERVGRETLDYVLQVMTHPEGGFYSAEDADSEGQEGKFYVWTQSELHQLLSTEEFEKICQVYNVTVGGNFEMATNHFNLNSGFGWDEKDNPLMVSAREKLFRVREDRVHPHKDDKILTAWNGLTIRAMATAYQATGEEKYLKAAHEAANFIKRNLYKDGRLLARFREGEGRFAARLEDYAFLIQGLIDLYQCDFQKEWIEWAQELQEIQNEIFWDGDNEAYFFTDGEDASLLFRSKEGMDGALPNANGVSVYNLLRLHDLLVLPEYRVRAEKIFQVFSRLFSEHPQAFSQMTLAYDYFTGDPYEVALLTAGSNEEAKTFIEKIHRGFFPNLVLAVGREGDCIPKLLADRKTLEGKPTLYLCQNQICEAPTNDLESGFALLDK